MNIANIRTIVKRELRSLLDNPATYVVAILFLVLWEFLFFLNAFLIGEASIRGLFDWFPWLSIVLVPAITMGAIAQEKSEGTLELVLTHPVKDLELIIGKFFSAWVYVGSLLLFAVPVALAFSRFGNLDFGVVQGQLLGSLLLTGAFCSLGIFVSSRFVSQVGALLVTAVSGFILIIIGSEFITVNVPLTLVSIFERLSIESHFQSLSRGVIDLRDVWYFSTFIVVFLSLSYLGLLQRKYGSRKDLYHSFQTGIVLFIGIAILTNILGSRIPGRIDLTAEKDYTLSSATQKILSTLPDIVTITLYASSKLPAQYAPIVRDTKDILRDYQTNAHGNIVFVTKDPAENPQISQEAQSSGVREVQFNVVGNEEFQVKTGYFGLNISYADKHETLPFIQQTNDLEYLLSSIIRKLTNKNKKTVTYLSGHGERNPNSDYRTFTTELDKQFTVDTVQIATATPQIASETAALVVAGPTTVLDNLTREAIQEFLKTGKSVLFLIDSFSLNPQTGSLTPTANPDNASDFLKGFGVVVNKDLVYDLRSHETVRLGSQNLSFLLPYPFWAGALPTKKGNKISGKTQLVIIPWASSMTLDEDKLKQDGYLVTKLLTTTPFSGSETTTANLSPDTYKYSETNLSEKLMAVALEPQPQSGITAKGNVVVMGDSDFLMDQFMQSSDNLNFGLSLVSWLAHDEALSGIKLHQGNVHKLVFKDAAQINLVKYGNMFLAFIVPAAIATLRIMRRKKLRLHHYKSV